MSAERSELDLMIEALSSRRTAVPKRVLPEFPKEPEEGASAAELARYEVSGMVAALQAMGGAARPHDLDEK